MTTAQNGMAYSDSDMVVLANALLLGYFNWSGSLFLEAWRFGLRPSKKDLARDRIESPVTSTLRDVLVGAGALDQLIEGLFGSDGFSSMHQFWQNAIDTSNSDHPISRVCIRDVALPVELVEKYEIDAVFSRLSGYEVRTPIARLGPTDATRLLMKVCIDYFRNTVPGTMSSSSHPAQPVGTDSAKSIQDLRSFSDAAPGERADFPEFGLGPWRGYDHAFVKEGFNLVVGSGISANEAASTVAKKYGTKDASKWSKDCGNIRAQGHEQAVKRLGSHIRKALKSCGYSHLVGKRR